MCIQGAGGAAGLFKDGSIDVLVMENIFYDRQISRIYDLKGSERSRCVHQLHMARGWAS